jgi:hypothetical protein
MKHLKATAEDELGTKRMDIFRAVRKFKEHNGERKIVDSKTGFGAFLDLALALYPIIIFWNLQLRLHVKIGLMVLFGFGVV